MATPEEIRRAAQQALANRSQPTEDYQSISEQIYEDQEKMFSGQDLYPEVEEEIVESRSEPRRSPGPEEKKARDNEIVWQGHPTWRGMIHYLGRGAVVWLGISLVLFLLSYFSVIPTFLFVLFSLSVLVGVFLVARLVIRTTVYTITRSHVSERRGIINTVSEQARLEQITNIQIKRNLYDRLVGIGKIDIDTASDVANLALSAQGERAKNKNILDWWGVPDPYQIQSTIDDLRSDRL